MQLYLSSPSAVNATYYSEEGHAVYKVQTPLKKTFGRTTQICRAITTDHLSPFSYHDHSLKDVFGHMAQFEWKTFGSSTLRYRGKELRTRDFFKKEDWCVHGCNRSFIASDGREYVWRLGRNTSELRDSSQRVVARFYKGKSTLRSGPVAPLLDIKYSGEHIADMILVTLVYMEKLREDD